MKNSNTTIGGKLPKLSNNKTRPENKDNLDSRAGEEQDFKGTSVTHNQKPKKNAKSKKGE